LNHSQQRHMFFMFVCRFIL